MSGFLFRSTHLVVSRSWLKGRGPNSPPSLRKSALKICQLRQKLKSLAKQTKRVWPSTSFGCSGTLREGSRAALVVTDGPFPKFLCCKINFLGDSKKPNGSSSWPASTAHTAFWLSSWDRGVQMFGRPIQTPKALGSTPSKLHGTKKK